MCPHHLLPIPIRLPSRLSFMINSLLGRNICMKMVNEDHKTLREAMRNRDLSEVNFHEIVMLCKSNLTQTTKIIDKKRNLKDNTEIKIGLDVDP